MRALRAVGRFLSRAAFVAFVFIVAAFPLPVMPIVLLVKKLRRREVPEQIVTRRTDRERPLGP